MCSEGSGGDLRGCGEPGGGQFLGSGEVLRGPMGSSGGSGVGPRGFKGVRWGSRGPAGPRGVLRRLRPPEYHSVVPV